MISVVIPLYNKEKQIKRTLQTVLKQTFQKYEIVIINDGSTDNSVVEVEKLKDPRIRLVHQKNAGVSVARNKGIEEAKYELIAFLDADDEWQSEYLTSQYELYQKYPECSIYACNYKFKDNNENISDTTIRKIPFREHDGILNNYFEVASCSHPPLWTSAVMVRKEAIKIIGGFPQGIKSGEDLLTWARLSLKFKIAYNKKAYCIFNNDKNNYNTDQQKRLPDIPDIVGNQLENLLIKYPKIKYLNTYISIWYKMRARVFLQKGLNKNARKDIRLSINHNLTWKNLIFYILTFFPKKIIDQIFK